MRWDAHNKQAEDLFSVCDTDTILYPLIFESLLWQDEKMFAFHIRFALGKLSTLWTFEAMHRCIQSNAVYFILIFVFLVIRFRYENMKCWNETCDTAFYEWSSFTYLNNIPWETKTLADDEIEFIFNYDAHRRIIIAALCELMSITLQEARQFVALVVLHTRRLSSALHLITWIRTHDSFHFWVLRVTRENLVPFCTTIDILHNNSSERTQEFNNMHIQLTISFESWILSSII